METYLVGGAVRDKLLGIEVKDRDWVVVGATPDELLNKGFQQVGQDFPVFLHPETKEEYALARTERKTGHGYKGFDFDASSSVTLKEDLLRRDLTINAMAEDEHGNIIDPYGGQYDLHNGFLRHVSKAFMEDPLRVLRVARFAARLAHRGFRVRQETIHLMNHMADSGELEHLVPERVWHELDLALNSRTPSEFIRVLSDCGALKIILPEVENLFGVPQPEKYHPEIDTGVHILMSLAQARKYTDDSAVIYATLVHDVGKGVTDPAQWPSHVGHETEGLRLLDAIESRLPVPKEYAALSRLVCEHHTKMHRIKELKPGTVLKLLETLDAFRRPERMEKFLLACEADARGRKGREDSVYPQRDYLTTIFDITNTIDNKEVIDASDLSPKEAIAKERLFVVTETIQALRGELD